MSAFNPNNGYSQFHTSPYSSRIPFMITPTFVLGLAGVAFGTAPIQPHGRVCFTDDSSTETYYLFQGSDHGFTVDAVRYKSAEQYMMAMKASTAGDERTLDSIMMADDAPVLFNLGRQIYFEKDANGVSESLKRWDEISYDTVYRGNWEKFTQNMRLKQKLLATGERTLILAKQKPDSNWGGGIDYTHCMRGDEMADGAKNKLGNILMEIRRTILEHETSLAD